MPAVAQINVNFANRQEFTELIPDSGVTSVKSVSPYTLLQYLLYDRESDDIDDRIKGPDNTDFYTYRGGVITAGDKINVKHSDFQITTNTDKPTLPGGNLDIEESIFVDTIFSRRKEKGVNYKSNRASQNRSVTISPRTNTTSSNFFKIETISNNRNISLFTLSNDSKRNKIEIDTNINNRDIIIETSVLSISADDTFNTGNITVNKDATFNRNVTIVGSNQSSQEFFKITNSSEVDKFLVDSSNGNTDIQGTLNVEGASNINNTLSVTDDVTLNKNVTIVGSNQGSQEFFRITNSSGAGKFSVDSATGNTNIQGTLNVESFSTFTDNITLDGGANKFQNERRVIGVRRFNDSLEMFGTTSYDEDALAVGDFKLYAFQKGMIILWNGNIVKDDNNVLVNPSGGWALCDGGSGTWNGQGFSTPDLRARFIVGAGEDLSSNNDSIPDNPKNYTKGATAGINYHKLTISELPTHNHDSGGSSAASAVISTNTSGGTHNHSSGSTFVTNVSRTGGGQFGSGENLSLQIGRGGVSITANQGSHTHAISFTLYGTGGETAHENRPPFYALYYIIKL